MGCTTCGRSSGSTTISPTITTVQRVAASTDCEFTSEQIAGWLDKVRCVQANAYYLQIPNITKKQINSYLSTLLSAGNYADNPCYFRNELEEVESFITVLTALNLCNN